MLTRRDTLILTALGVVLPFARVRASRSANTDSLPVGFDWLFEHWPDDEIYNKIKHAYAEGDYERVRLELAPLLEKRDTHAAFLQGLMYDRGNGVPVAPEKANELWRKRPIKMSLWRLFPRPESNRWSGRKS